MGDTGGTGAGFELGSACGSEGTGDVACVRHGYGWLRIDSAGIAVDWAIRFAGIVWAGWGAGGVGSSHVSGCIVGGPERNGGSGLAWEGGAAGQGRPALQAAVRFSGDDEPVQRSVRCEPAADVWEWFGYPSIGDTASASV